VSLIRPKNYLNELSPGLFGLNPVTEEPEKKTALHIEAK
jgi:hypothetical protein